MAESPEQSTASAPVRPYLTRTVRLGRGDAVETWLEVQQTTLTWGAVLTGSLVFKAQRTPRQITHPIYSYLEYADDETSHRLAEHTLSEAPFTVALATFHRVPFGLVIPGTAPFRYPVSFRVTAAVDGHWAHGPQLNLHVVPPVTCMRIVAEFCSVAGMVVRGWDVSAPGEAGVRLAGRDRRAVFTIAHLRLSGGEAFTRVQLAVSKRSAWSRPRYDEYFEFVFEATDPHSIRDRWLNVIRMAGFRPAGVGDLPLPAMAGATRPEDLPIPMQVEPQPEHEEPVV